MLNDITRSEIAVLRASGVALADDDIAELALAGYLAEHVSSGYAPILRRRSVVVGNLVLHPITMQAARWIAHSTALDWFSFSPKYDFLSTVYALVHGRTVGAFASLYHIGATVGALDKFESTIAADAEELSDAVRRVIGAIDDGEETERSSDDFVSSCELATGISRERLELMTCEEIIRMMQLHREVGDVCDGKTDFVKLERALGYKRLLSKAKEIRDKWLEEQ